MLYKTFIFYEMEVLIYGSSCGLYYKSLLS